MRETQVRSLGQEDPLEKEIATHSSILAWRSPCMKEPGTLQSMGSQSWTRLRDFTFTLDNNKLMKNRDFSGSQWLRFWASTAGDTDLTPGLGWGEN